MSRKPFLEVAENLFNDRFTKAKVMFAAGSLVRGDGNEKSDIDCYVVFDAKDCPQAYRETIIFQDYICEIFIQNEYSWKYFTAKEPDDGEAVVQSMVMEGIPFGDQEFARMLKERMKEIHDKGPTPWSDDKIQMGRYSITDLMDDLPGKNEYEQIGTLSVLHQKLGNFYLRANNQWSGSRKSLDRILRGYNPEYADKYGKAFELAFKQNDLSLLEKLVDETLAPFGGRLMDGCKSFAPDAANKSVD